MTYPGRRPMPVAPPRNQYPTVRPVNGNAIAALVFAFIVPPLAIAFANTALSEIKRRNERGKELAVAALVLGHALTTVLVVVAVVLLRHRPTGSTGSSCHRGGVRGVRMEVRRRRVADVVRRGGSRRRRGRAVGRAAHRRSRRRAPYQVVHRAVLDPRLGGGRRGRGRGAGPRGARRDPQPWSSHRRLGDRCGAAGVCGAGGRLAVGVAASGVRITRPWPRPSRGRWSAKRSTEIAPVG